MKNKQNADDSFHELKRDKVVDFLDGIPDEELLSILGEVFSGRVPYPLEKSNIRSHFLLAIAKSTLINSPGEKSEEVWSQWFLGAIAYPNPLLYTGDNLGPKYGFCQFGVCNNCHTYLASNVKESVCPICGYYVSLT